jgi:acetyl esterase/lipase
VLIILLHGGFWRASYDRSHTGPLAAALAAENFVVCAPEYRRTGQPGGGWPGTFDDVAAAVDALPELVRRAAGRVGGSVTGGLAGDAGGGVAGGLAGDAGGWLAGGAGGGRPAGEEWRVVLAGHSAGGHLALWAAGRHRLPAGSPWRTGSSVRTGAPGPADLPGPAGLPGRPGLPEPAGLPWEVGRSSLVCGVVALAPVSDLAACYRDGLGSNAADALLGGGPGEWPERYAVTDPAGLVPLGVPVRIVHGNQDEAVPCAMSREFAHRAGAAGDDAVLTELPGYGHFDVIDPLSGAWGGVLAAFRAVAEGGAG